MIPIGDDSRLRRFPFVVWALIAANFMVFFRELSLDASALKSFVSEYGLTPALLFHSSPGTPPGLRFSPLLSYQFLHGGWLHLLGNMWVLRIFGDDVEDRFGHIRFLLFYLAAGVASGLMHALLSVHSEVPLVGASGAVAGTMGAYLVWRPLQRVRLWLPVFVFFVPVALPAFVYLLVWFALQVIGARGATAMGTGVAFDAHVAGFVFGVLVMVRSRLSGRRRRR